MNKQPNSDEQQKEIHYLLDRLSSQIGYVGDSFDKLILALVPVTIPEKATEADGKPSIQPKTELGVQIGDFIGRLVRLQDRIDDSLERLEI